MTKMTGTMLFAVLACLCALTQAAHQLPSQVADKTYLTRQKNIYELFWHVDQPTVYHPELYQHARTFNIAENVDNYADKEAVTEFIEYLKHGMLPRGHVFSVMDPDVHRQTVMFYRVLHSAKTFEVFYNTAVWARFHVNEQMYVYALTVAVLHRPDTKYLKVPPMYEVLPHFFFTEEVMHKAADISMGNTVGVKTTGSGSDHFVIPVNNTFNFAHTMSDYHDVLEQKMSYFTEDIGLNYFYFLTSHYFPSYMHANDMSAGHLPQIRGEYYFFLHKQLLTRYYLERLSNGLGEINYVSVDKPIMTGFYPNMHYHNGVPFPHREAHAVVPLSMHKYVQRLKDLHTRISNAIDIGYALDTKGGHVSMLSPAGLNILGNMVQGNADTVNKQYYGHLDVLARKIFGFGLQTHVKYESVPSALEIFCTSMRDPVFYSIYKNILGYYHRYKKNMPMYKTEELSFPGVNVESMTVDPLTTYFDTFESMLNNGVSIRSHKEAKKTLIKALQYRLNHKPYTHHIVINSDKNTKAVFRIFIGPKFDEFGHEFTIENNYMNFMQMDEWVVDLKSGRNTVSRSSHESIFVVPDEVPSEVFYKKIVTSMEGSETFKYSTQPYGFPERLMLPKGTKDGMQYKLFVVVTPFDESKSMQIDSSIFGQVTLDGRPRGFPLDRPVDPLHFVLPNMYFKDVTIFHKDMDQLNVVV